MRRVVITGIGVISPIGIGAKAFWENLTAGQVGVRRITQYDPSGFPSQIAGEVPAYKINDFVPKSYRKATKVMARDIELAVIAADDAFKRRGAPVQGLHRLPHHQLPAVRLQHRRGAHQRRPQRADGRPHHRAGRGRPEQAGPASDGAARGCPNLTPLWLLKYLPNMLACHVTIIHELKGPSNTITCADASSHLAIGEAFRTVQRGDADLAICGGAETKVVPMNLMRQILLKRVTESHNDTPQQAVRPFDAAGHRYGGGRGRRAVHPRRLRARRGPGAKIYAEVVGFGASQDTYSVTEPDPKGHSYGRAIGKALAEANLPPAAVDLLVPCGLGIPGHDQAELAGLHQVFGGGLERVPLGPIKAQTGNLAAGSGVDAAAAVLALHHGRIPPAVNTKKPVGGLKLNVSPEARDAEVNVSVSSVYSLGGQNAALVFKKV